MNLLYKSRRQWILSAGTSALLLPAQSVFGQATALRPTPSQTEGPFYPLREPVDADFDLLQNGNKMYSQGKNAWVKGNVIDTTGKPLAGAVVEIWQCDADGHYGHPQDGNKMSPNFQGFGRVKAGSAGEFTFRTIKPSPYAGRTPHIHVKIWLNGSQLLTTQLYVEGDPGNSKDFIWRSLQAQDQALVTKPFVPSAAGLTASYTLVVRI